MHRAGGDSRRGRRQAPAAVWLPLLALLVLLVPALLAPRPAAAFGPAGPPLVLQPDVGLAAQFGYAPPYTRNLPSFDAEGRAYLRSRTASGGATSYVHTLADGRWQRLDFVAALRAAYPDFVQTVGAGGLRGEGVVFDRQDRAYNLLTIRLRDGSTRNVLMVSWDHCRTWKVFELPPGDVACETFSGHNEIDGPPFLAIWRPSLSPYTGSRGSRHTLWVTKPRLEGDQLVIPAPTLVTEDCLGLYRDSGGASFAASHDGTTWFVWPASSVGPSRGVPTCIAAYDHATGAVSPPRVLAVTPPANDPHNKPGICLDSQGYLHVVAGAHGSPMLYTRSLAPYDADAGWTAPVPVTTDGWETATDPPRVKGRQTYVSLVCDSHDTLHLVTRQWRRGVDAFFEGRAYGALVHQECPKGGTWSRPTLVVVPPAPGYAIYYQKLALGPGDRLFLSCSYDGGPEHWRARARSAGLALLGRSAPGQGKYRRRMLLVSDDGGLHWRFATDADLAPPEAGGGGGGAPAAPGAAPAALRAAARPGAARAAPGRAPAGARGGLPTAAARWLSPWPQGDHIAAIDVADDGRGWAVGTHGTVLRTVDGGQTWTPQASGTEADLFAVAAVDGAVAWAVGEAGTVLRTDDGGATWTRLETGRENWLFAVAALSSRTAWAAGTRGLVLVTRDGGATWQRQRPGTAENLYALRVLDSRRGWVAGAFGVVCRTTDGGRTWQRVRTPTNAGLFGLDFADRSHGLAVGGGGTVLRSEDGGRTWEGVESGTGAGLRRVRLRGGVALAVGGDGTVLRSSDGGRTWRLRRLSPAVMLNALDRGPRGAALLGGAAGTIWRSTDAGRGWTRVTHGLATQLRAATATADGLWVCGAGGLLARVPADATDLSDPAAWLPAATATAADLDALAFRGERGWAVGEAGTVLRTDDGGASWTALPPPVAGDLRAVAAPADDAVWLAGDDGVLLGSDDGGAHWQAHVVVTEHLTSLAFSDRDHGLAGGSADGGEGRAFVLRTADGGATWQRVDLPLWGKVRALAALPDGRAWAAVEDWGPDGDEAGGAVVASDDGGLTWTVQASGLPLLDAITVSADGSGWAVGADGTVLHTSDGVTWARLPACTDVRLRACVAPAPLPGPQPPAALALGDDGAVLALAAP